jgi:hypothetical protein
MKLLARVGVVIVGGLAAVASGEPVKQGENVLGKECRADADCGAAPWRCLPLDARGHFSGPTERRICTRPCDDGCPSEWGCDEYRSIEIVERNRRRVAQPKSERVCAPRPPKYASVAAGGACASDLECADAAPVCLKSGSGSGGTSAAGACVRLCKDGCAAGQRCQSVQRLRTSRIENLSVCLADKNPR